MTLVTIATSLLAGGGVGGLIAEVLRHRRESHTINTADFTLFQTTWQAEMSRLHAEIRQLRRLVVAMSKELEKVGVDPIQVRLAALHPTEGDPRA